MALAILISSLAMSKCFFVCEEKKSEKEHIYSGACVVAP